MTFSGRLNAPNRIALVLSYTDADCLIRWTLLRDYCECKGINDWLGLSLVTGSNQQTGGLSQP